MNATASIEYLIDLRDVMAEKGFECNISNYKLYIKTLIGEFDIDYVPGEWVYVIGYGVGKEHKIEYTEHTSNAAKIILSKLEKKVYLEDEIKFLDMLNPEANIIILFKSGNWLDKDLFQSDCAGNHKINVWKKCFESFESFKLTFPVKKIEFVDFMNYKLTLDCDYDDEGISLFEVSNEISLSEIFS